MRTVEQLRAVKPGDDPVVDAVFEALVEFSGRRRWYGYDLAAALVDTIADLQAAEAAIRWIVRTERWLTSGSATLVVGTVGPFDTEDDAHAWVARHSPAFRSAIVYALEAPDAS